MAGQNTAPIYSLVPVIASAVLMTVTVANVRSDGLGNLRILPTGSATDEFIILTAGANGTYVSKIRIQAAATVATTVQVGVIRIYVASVKDAGTATTSANSWLIQEVSTAALAAASTTVAIPFYEIPMNFALPPNYTLFCTLSVVDAAQVVWFVTAFGGDY